MMSEEIRIYVADLAVYNSGKLHGVWINATDELDDIQDQINKMLESSPEIEAEEYAIHDYEDLLLNDHEHQIKHRRQTPITQQLLLFESV